jgi:hypothetical protein
MKGTTMPFHTRPLRIMACPAVGLCFLVGCSSAESPASPGTPAPRPLEDRSGVPLAPGTYQIGFHLDADEDVPDAFVTVPSGYVESSTWYVVSDDGHEYFGLWTAREADRDACRVDLVWILDADGQRIVVNAAYSAGSTTSDIHKLTAMAESLRFVPANEE